MTLKDLEKFMTTWNQKKLGLKQLNNTQLENLSDNQINSMILEAKYNNETIEFFTNKNKQKKIF